MSRVDTEFEDLLVIAWADFYGAKHSMQRTDAARRINELRAAIRSRVQP